MHLKFQFFVYLICLNLKYAFTIKCDRTPEGFSANKSPSDGRYLLKIVGNPERYDPGETYTVILQAIRQHQIQHKFIGFAISAEPDYSEQREQFAISYKPKSDEVGTFQLMPDSIAIFSAKCPGLVQHSSSVPKTEVQVLWTAPSSGSGCIALRGTVIEHRDVWYKDDGRLSKILCEDEIDSLDSQLPINNPCCACDEAKYELTFEGLWSRHTHPKDFPSNGWLTRFSDVIGASHTVDYRFWDYGRKATDGLQQIAEHGSTRKLEHELKEESEHIRTIIKARGIAYPNVTGKTFAVFRVDSNNHLVSLVSQIDPSPDWFVGVSGLELCMANCSWIENKVLNLYPWDAGTDSGATYISPDQPTFPRDSIRRIKTNFPNDPRSPFYDQSGSDMKPMARLYLKRQRVYEKVCEGDNAEQDSDNACETTSWGPWGECNVPCGQGKRFRQRSYTNPVAASKAHCKKSLTLREICQGTNCDPDEFNPDENTNEDDENPVDPDCELTPWGPWSECSTKCGLGSRTRSRRFKNKKMAKKCSKGRPNPPQLQETQECRSEEECVGDITPEPLSKNRGQPNNRNRGKRCKMTDWSDWTPCTATCGMGFKMRSRYPVHKHQEFMSYHRSLVDRFQRRSNNGDDDDDDDDNNDDNNDEDQDNDDDDENDNDGGDENSRDEKHFSNKIQDPDDPCYGETTIEEVRCGHDLPPCKNGLYGTPGFCFLDPVVGPCRVTANRWYFDKNKGDCSIFPYTECGGNRNNFLSREDCLDVCKRPGSNSMDSLIRDQVRSHQEPNPPTSNEKVNCKVSEWKRQSCNVTCGEGYRIKTRTILTRPQNGGRRCPSKLKKFERCYVKCNSESASNRVHENNNNDESNETHQYDCRYSAWSAWSPCSKSCGEGAVQQRSRRLLNRELSGVCTKRLEERPCEYVLPCITG